MKLTTEIKRKEGYQACRKLGLVNITTKRQEKK
jgi:hypothetical protein